MSTLTSYVRTAPPPLEYRAPDCPGCSEEVTCDGEAMWCEGCGFSWGAGSEDPGESDTSVPECRTEVTPWAGSDCVLGGHRYRCILAEDHGDRHYGLRVDQDPWAPDPDDLHWSDGRWPAPAPAVHGPVLPPGHPARAHRGATLHLDLAGVTA